MTNEQLKDFFKALNETDIEDIKNIVLVKNKATNGDVIKCLFPNEHDFETDFDEQWWNALYQGDDQ